MSINVYFNRHFKERLIVYVEKIIDEFKEPDGDSLSIYRSAPFFIEVMAQGIDKAASLQALIERLGIKQEEVISFGDGYNDLSMIEFAGMGVAMENAVDQVKQCADYITLSNDDEGIYECLKLLNEKGISCSVINMHTIKPLDSETLDKVIHSHKLIVTVEEHSEVGGLGGAVAEYMVAHHFDVRLEIIGIKDFFPHAGDYRYQLEQSGLTAFQICERIEKLL